jgi:neopullulanase
MKKILSFFYFLFLISILSLPKDSFSQHAEIYPSNWWVGMKWNKVQLMVHEKNISTQTFTLTPYAGVKLLKINKIENPNYVFLDLLISPNTKPGKLNFNCYTDEGPNYVISFELKPRRSGNGTSYAQGVTSKDFVYLLMPDRFSNGDPSNDKVPGMRDQSLNRDDIFLRHGGDLQGAIDHLDYLKDLGVTTLWMTPVLENDMQVRTEHGYAITNHYKVDPRLGSNELYKKLSDELHKRGMKLIQDAVYNHMGSFNFLQLDPPSKDWVHQWPGFTHPNYKDQTLFDPYVAQADKKFQTDGWFDRIMPDINQKNTYAANFLIQNAIWCVEEFGVDGWRIDTYIYCDLDFMNRCNKALMDEYPHITMFGECWVSGTANEAYFAQNNMNTPFKSNLIGVTDFQSLFDGIYPAIKESNCDKLYQTLSNDFLYKNPMNNVIFLDNHDMTRFYSEVGEDIDKLKMGIAWLLTERGVPQLYYGTEILMKGIKNPDGYVRLDFPGGWKDDPQNKFSAAGRTDNENAIFNYTKAFASFRKNSSAITTGKMMQYVPVNGVYVYFRYNNKQTVMCVMNTNNQPSTIDLSRFSERMKGFSKAYDVATGVEFTLQDTLTLGGKYLLVMELRK